MSNGDCCKGLKEQLASLNREVSNTKQEFQKANEKINSLERQLQQANNKIDSQGSEIRNLKQRVSKIEGDLKTNKLGANDSKNITQLIARISKLESYCGSVEQYLMGITSLISAVRSFLK